MGGKAFAALLPNALFPRLPSAQYAAQKQLLLPRVQRFFREVTVPVEAPEKVDHGDLDILAFEPLEPDERGDYDFEAVKQALGAETVIRATGNRTSNFALPLPDGYGVTASDGDSGLKYFQVDIQVCEDRREFERIKFFHSYGDMGMLLGLVGKGVGLPTGAKGLHTGLLREDGDEPIPARFDLCDDFRAILPFFGLSYARWEEGFRTKSDLSEWIRSSRWFDAGVIHDPRSGANSRKDRTFYHAFIAEAAASARAHPDSRPKRDRKQIREEAVDHFGKRTEWKAVCAAHREERARLDLTRQSKDLLSSTKVVAWTGVDKANWRLIKNTIRMVRAELGGEESMIGLSEDELKAAVMRVLPAAEELSNREWEEWVAKKNMEAVEELTKKTADLDLGSQGTT